MIDVMFYEIFKEERAALEKFLPKTIKARFTWKTIQEAGSRFPPASFICVRTQSRISGTWSGQLKSVLTRSRGYDHLTNFRRENRSGVALGYLGDYCSQAVAEHAVMVMMVLLKKLNKQIKHFDNFNRDDLTGLECGGRRALVIGVGHIGTKIVKLLKALNVKVKGVDIDHRLNSVEYVTLQKGLRWANVVFCTLPLTTKTNRLLDYKMFKLAKPGVVFINIARGEIAPLQDLKYLLKEKILGGLALDVYEQEDELAVALRGGHQKPIVQKIIKEMGVNDNVVLTPHNAFNTHEAVERKAEQTAKSVIYFFKHKTFPYCVPTTK